MMTEDKDKTGNQDQRSYESPKALRLGAVRSGRGGEDPPCRGPGSGASGDCLPGVSAQFLCLQTGSSADKCDLSGSGATPPPNP
jgi:hypothetical protein